MEYKSFRIEDLAGNAVPGATVNVYLTGTTTHATGLQDFAGGAVTSPFTADAVTGKVGFRAPNGTYDIVMVRGDFQDALYGTEFFDIEDANIDRSGRYDSVQALLDSTDPARGEGKVWQGGVRLFTEAAVGAFDYHEITAGGVGLYEAGDRFTTRERAESGDTLGSDVIYIGDLAFGLDGAGTALTTGDGWTRSPAGMASPEHYGAAGDGVADDTAAVQGAMNSALPYKGRLGAAYKITSAVTVPSNKIVDFNGSKIVRGFNDSWMLQNSTAGTTADNKNITFIDPWLEDGGTFRGNFFLMAGVDGLRVSNLRVVGTTPEGGGGIGAWAQYYEGDDIVVTGSRINTWACGLYGDGLHVGCVRRFVYTDFAHRSGDDGIALYNPPSSYFFVVRDHVSGPIYVGNGTVESNTSNGLRLGSASGCVTNAAHVGVTVEGVEFGHCDEYCLEIGDFRAAPANKSDQIVLSNMNFGSQAQARLININGNPDITSAANYTIHNFGTIRIESCSGVNNGAQLIRAGGIDTLEMTGLSLRHALAIASASTGVELRQIDSARFTSGRYEVDSTSNAMSLNYVLSLEWDGTVIVDVNPAFRAINLALNTDQTSSIQLRGGAILGADRGIDDTGTGSVQDFVVAGTDIVAATSIYAVSATPAGRDVRKDLSVI